MSLLNVKRGTTPTLEIKFNNVDFADVKSIDFVFKHQKSESGRVIVEKKYPVDGTCKDGVVKLRFTESETRKFTSGSVVYMDTRIILSDGSIPETSIAEFNVNPTLFEERKTI